VIPAVRLAHTKQKIVHNVLITYIYKETSVKVFVMRDIFHIKMYARNVHLNVRHALWPQVIVLVVIRQAISQYCNKNRIVVYLHVKTRALTVFLLILTLLVNHVKININIKKNYISVILFYI
jgi:hypothetical protein